MDLAYPDFDKLRFLFRSSILHCIIYVVPFVHLYTNKIRLVINHIKFVLLTISFK